ncbi:hypothetical protein GQ44DRAFT_711503 [Phaeosphaeriaceae sp. PMI808]|nr:hypothetical protein GQ44DRAFT_711503 [Phaeosphaeriaceae sp. PMI808]
MSNRHGTSGHMLLGHYCQVLNNRWWCGCVVTAMHNLSVMGIQFVYIFNQYIYHVDVLPLAKLAICYIFRVQ